MKPIKAVIAEVTAGRAKYEYERKELVSGFNKNLITVKFYMGRSSNASVVYCNIWLGNDTHCASGTGSAGGGGYHKKSAALQEAIDSAGIALSSPIDGRGDSSMREAIKAIGKCLGYRKTFLISF
jgi:hypothetical protein